MTDVTASVRSAVADQHADVLDGVCRCADGVAANWCGAETRERSDVVGPMEASLRQSGLWETLPTALVTAVDAVGGNLRARPVAGAPYLVMTSTGPILRATLPQGRLVVRLKTFDIEHEGSTTLYRRRDASGGDIVDAELR